MDILTTDISSLSFKVVKEKVDEININEAYNSKELIETINILRSDKRKNINSLGDKLQKAKEKIENEIKRVRNMYNFDKSFEGYNIIAGVDEVGRGPLAGPIVSCAVVLDLNVIDEDLILWINDSKKLNERKREELAAIIKEKALAYYVASRNSKEIDERGIGVCNNEVFFEACTNLKVKPDLVLSDGYTVKGIQIPNKSVIKGDTKSACIAAASIVAKVYRDNLMKEYAEKYPYYGFEENVGYGTTKHIEGIKEYGPTEIHRVSFLTNILSNNK
ncbi:MAG: ribonuclease HII [Clostridium celatum]|nr:ribonuclease HII [Clostridium celatum]MDU2122370.1 ribonuclease HII [Clostridium celatum]MDU4978378.1 ribonuclease HII [Clostridium celatum]